MHSNRNKFWKFLKKDAPLGYKYCLTLVPRETDSIEKVATKNVKPSTNTSNPEQPKRHQISMHGAVVSNTEYQEKISKAKEADEKKSKIFKQKIVSR